MGHIRTTIDTFVISTVFISTIVGGLLWIHKRDHVNDIVKVHNIAKHVSDKEKSSLSFLSDKEKALIYLANNVSEISNYGYYERVMDIIENSNDKHFLEKSMKTFKEKLKQYPIEEKPTEYARLTENIGNSYYGLYESIQRGFFKSETEKYNEKQHLENSIFHYEEALEIYDQDTKIKSGCYVFTEDYERASDRLSVARHRLFDFTHKIKEERTGVDLRHIGDKVNSKFREFIIGSGSMR